MPTWTPPGWNQERIARAVAAKEERIRRLRAEYQWPQRAPLGPEHPCEWCSADVHTPKYDSDGVARCTCCKADLTNDTFPRLELNT